MGGRAELRSGAALVCCLLGNPVVSHSLNHVNETHNAGDMGESKAKARNILEYLTEHAMVSFGGGERGERERSLILLCFLPPSRI